MNEDVFKISSQNRLLNHVYNKRIKIAEDGVDLYY